MEREGRKEKNCLLSSPPLWRQRSEIRQRTAASALKNHSASPILVEFIRLLRPHLLFSHFLHSSFVPRTLFGPKTAHRN